MGSGGGGSDSKSFGQNWANSSGEQSSYNESGGENVSQSNQDVWAGQSPYLQKLYGATDHYGNQALQGTDSYTPEATNAMSQARHKLAPTYNTQAEGGVTGNHNPGDYYAESMLGSFNSPTQMQNAYGGTADTLNMAARQNAMDTRQDMLNATDSRAAASGMSGSSRQGVMQAQGQQDINNQLQNVMAQNQAQDVDRRLGVADRADQQTLQRQQMLQGDIAEQNRAQQFSLGNLSQINQGIMQGYDPYRQNLQNLGIGAQIIGGPTSLTQSGSYGNQYARGGSTGTNQSSAYGYTDANSQTDPRYTISGGTR